MKLFTVFLFILFSNSPTYAEKINDRIVMSIYIESIIEISS